jgi:outer membrane protein assembly factor BamB
VDQVIVSTPALTVGVDANSGKQLWASGAWKCRIPIANAVPLGDGRVFLTGGYGAGAAMLQVKKTGARFVAKRLFKAMECNGQIQQPLLCNGHLYLNGNDKAKKNGFMCMSLNGKVLWKTGRNPGFDWGGLLLADGMIYAVDGTKGDLCMIKPDPAGYREVARFNVFKGPSAKNIWAPIAMADGKILLRDQKFLKCVDVRGK